jgi:hypothetical protein
VAWVLTPSVPTGLPAPSDFEAALARAGGSFRRAEAGAAVVYHGFEPPFGPAVVPLKVPGAVALGDGDPRTGAEFTGPEPRTFTLPETTRLDAVTLVAPVEGPRLLRSMDVEVSADGATFATVAERRRRGERDDLRWVAGHPQYVVDNDVLSVPLGGRSVRAVRVRPIASDEPWALAELLLHPAGGTRAWDEWLDPRLSWSARADALLREPRPDRVDWHSRALLALRRSR